MPLVTLSETLKRFQEEEERKVMALADDTNRELMYEFYERTKITSEDLSREYSEDDIRELCLRTKVRVNMTHMNCVWDAKKRLERKGRLENRSRRFINAMLAKAVNRRMVEPCSDEEIAKYHHINVCHIKKDNNVRLNRWKKERQKQLDEELQQEDGTDAEVEELEAAFLSENEETDGAALMSVADGKDQSEALDMPNLELVNIRDKEIASDSIEEEGHADAEDGVLIINETEHLQLAVVEGLPPISTETENCIPNKESQQYFHNRNAESQNDEMGAHIDWLKDVNEINSESMTLNSDEMLQESELQSQSQGLAADYTSFDTQVRTTSTQDAETEAFIA